MAFHCAWYNGPNLTNLQLALACVLIVCIVTELKSLESMKNEVCIDGKFRQLSS